VRVRLHPEPRGAGCEFFDTYMDDRAAANLATAVHRQSDGSGERRLSANRTEYGGLVNW
jgi:hypothetical protein